MASIRTRPKLWFVVPAILEAVERGVSPGALAGMILWFTVGMALVRALRGYLDTNAMFDRIQVRSTLCLDLHMTFCRTSFPHIEDPDYLKRTEEAEKCVTDNNGGGEAEDDAQGDDQPAFAVPPRPPDHEGAVLKNVVGFPLRFFHCSSPRERA